MLDSGGSVTQRFVPSCQLTGTTYATAAVVPGRPARRDQRSIAATSRRRRLHRRRDRHGEGPRCRCVVRADRPFELRDASTEAHDHDARAVATPRSSAAARAGQQRRRRRLPGRRQRHGARPDRALDRRHPYHGRHATSPTPRSSGIDVTEHRRRTRPRRRSSTPRSTSVSALRGKLGAAQNRFESTIANLQVTTENLSASESRIRDTDMASEMVNFTRDQILLQAGTAMLAQANAAPQTVLQVVAQ